MPVNNLYLMLIDLDRFKAVNDGLGHETGDGLLKIVGRRLLAIASEHDTVARMPGDQFAILFHGDKPKRDILTFTDKVRTTVSKPVNMRPQEIFLTASIGVSALREGSLTAEGLVKDAAVALYEAKRRGKWVHVGRVNTKRRVEIARAMKADSIDGTACSRWPDTKIPAGLRWVSSLPSRTGLASRHAADG